MAAIPSFKYVPLPQPTSIRLVVLEQDSGEEQIRCNLISVENSNKPTYEALSYEWGSIPNRKRPIYINGAWYEVRKNLYDALFIFEAPTPIASCGLMLFVSIKKMLSRGINRYILWGVFMVKPERRWSGWDRRRTTVT
jgi:Heterokaryon incompatibility protein (HET)